jgi:hypothetical protein
LSQTLTTSASVTPGSAVKEERFEAMRRAEAQRDRYGEIVFRLYCAAKSKA